MVAAKAELFTGELRERAKLFKALAHPARIQIIQYLIHTKRCLSGDISGMFPLTRTTVNQHMKELRDAGLVRGYVKGSKIYYCLEVSKIEEMKNILEGFLGEIHIPGDFCCQLQTC